MPNDLQYLKKALSTALADHLRLTADADLRRDTGNEATADRIQQQHIEPLNSRIADLKQRIAAMGGSDDSI